MTELQFSGKSQNINLISYNQLECFLSNLNMFLCPKWKKKKPTSYDFKLSINRETILDRAFYTQEVGFLTIKLPLTNRHSPTTPLNHPFNCFPCQQIQRTLVSLCYLTYCHRFTWLFLPLLKRNFLHPYRHVQCCAAYTVIIMVARNPLRQAHLCFLPC